MGNAAKHKQLGILKYLTAQSLAEDIVRESPSRLETYEMISWAVQGGSLECVSVLLELNNSLVHCMSPHHMGYTPLRDAMYLKPTQCLPMTKLLLSYSADPNARPVMIDAYNLQSSEVFRVLVDAGGNTNLFGNNMVNEQSICRAASIGNIAAVENLIIKGVDVNATYPYGNQYDRGPALCSAIQGNRHDIIVLLLTAGADPKVVNCLGESSIQLAEAKGDEGKEIQRLLKNVPGS